MPNPIKRIIGPSPIIFIFRKSKNFLAMRGGESPYTEIDQPLTDAEFFANLIAKYSDKPRRLTPAEVQKLYFQKSLIKRDHRLLESVMDEAIIAQVGRQLPEGVINNVLEMHVFRTKYKRYLRIKRLIPLALVAPFTNSELTKMAYAAALNSKSVSLTLPGLIGYSLPAFFFCHMTYYYVPDKLKPICSVGKYVLGAPIWVISALVDQCGIPFEEKFFGEPVAIDLTQTGGTIPSDLGNLDDLRAIIEETKAKMGAKSYGSFS